MWNYRIILLLSGLLIGIAIFSPLNPAPLLAKDFSRPTVDQNCYVDVQWERLTDLRRGPSYNYGITRQIPAQIEMRVFGRNEKSDWFQVFLGEPWNKVGWVWIEDDIKLFGNCDNLPITTDNIEPEAPLDALRQIPLPDYTSTMEFSEDERVFKLNEGMLYVRHEADELRVHIVIADLSHPNLRLETALIATPGSKNGFLSEYAADSGAFVALNGDFYTSSFVPQNLMINNYELITAPKKRATFALTEDREAFLGYFTEDWTWDANVFAENGLGIPLQLLNIPCDDTWVCLYSDIWETLSLRQGYNGIRALLSPDYEVLQVELDQTLRVPDGHFVLRAGANTEAGDWLVENLEIGSTVEINTVTDPDWRDYQYAIGGGPMIVKNGRFWQDCDPDTPEARRICEEFGTDFRRSHYGNVKLARSAIGYNPDDHALILIMVEGKNVYASKGITQEDLAEIFIRLGASEAMEFDGGGSSMMWLNNAPVNGIGELGERAVVNALVLFWDEDTD